MNVRLPDRTTQEAEIFRRVHEDFVSARNRPPTVGELKGLVLPKLSEAGFEKPTTQKKFEARLSRVRKALVRISPSLSTPLPIELPHRSGVYDVDLREVYSGLRKRFNTKPHIGLLREELSRQGIGDLSQDALRDRLNRLHLYFQEEARFRQGVIVQAAREHKAETAEPLKFSSLKKRLETKGLKLSEKEISRAIYALRRRSGNDIKELVGLTRERRKPIYTTRQQLIYSYYRFLRSSGKEAVTYAALEKQLSRLPSSSHGLSRSAITRRDQIIKSIKQINGRVGDDQKIVLVPDQKTQLRDEQVKKGATEYIEKNQGVIDIPGFKAFLSETQTLHLRPGQIRASLRRLEKREGAGQVRLPTAPYQSATRNIDIVAAHEKVSARLSKLGVGRSPSLKEIQGELLHRRLTISRSAIRGRLEGINTWRRTRKAEPGKELPVLTYSIHTDLKPYAILQAHKELSKVGSGQSPTRAAVANKATELLGAAVKPAHVEAYCSPHRTKEGGRDGALWRSLGQLTFTQPRRSGLSVEKLSRYIKEYQDKYVAPPTRDEVLAFLESDGVRVTRQHLSEVVRSLRVSLAYSRAHQAQLVCKKAVDSFRKRCDRDPMVDEIVEDVRQSSALPLSREQVFAALRAVRAAAPAWKKHRYSLEHRNLNEMLVKELDAAGREGAPLSLAALQKALGLSRRDIEDLVRKQNVERARVGREHIVLEGTKLFEDREMFRHYATCIGALERARRDDGRRTARLDHRKNSQGFEEAIQRSNELAAHHGIALLPNSDEFRSYVASNLRLRLVLSAAFVMIHDAGLRPLHDKHKEPLYTAEQNFNLRAERIYGPFYPLRGYPKVLLHALYQGRLDLKTCQGIWQNLISPTASFSEIERRAAEVLGEICRKAGVFADNSSPAVSRV